LASRFSPLNPIKEFLVNKRILPMVLVLGLLGLSMPVANLFLFKGTPFKNFNSGHPEADRVRASLEKKCLSCHATDGVAPYYAALPVAKQLIRRDMETGTRMFDLSAMMNPPAGQLVSEAALAKLEYVLNEGGMPPPQFLVAHWDCLLSASEKESLKTFINETRGRAYATGTAAEEFKNDVLQPLPDTVRVIGAKVALGKQLYNDTRLSGDGRISCATCHDLAKGGTDRLQFSKGIKDQVGPINAPTVYNSGFNFIQFWDGRAKDLKEQAGGPVTNPLEMGAEWPKVLAVLKKDAAFVSSFRTVYPDGLTSDNVQDAIAEFEKTLITPNSRFDKYLKGDKTALLGAELKGYHLFRDRGCATCHVGKIMGGQSFEKMGLQREYFASRGNLTEADNGRFNATKLEKDRYMFKVPTLRNIDKTAPYFHDGQTSDLKEAVKIMAKAQTEDGLSDKEADEVAAFLKTLTGEYEGKPLE